MFSELRHLFSSILSLIVGVATINKIWTTFDIKKNVFTIIFIESIGTFLCSLLYFCLQIYQIFPGENLAILCHIEFFCIFFPSLFLNYMNFLISVIRYKIVTYGAVNKVVKELILRVIVLCVAVVIFAYCITVTATFYVLEKKFAILIEVCILDEGQESQDVPFALPPYTNAIVAPPNMPTFIGALVTDAMLVRFLKRSVFQADASPNDETNKSTRR